MVQGVAWQREIIDYIPKTEEENDKKEKVAYQGINSSSKVRMEKLGNIKKSPK